MQQRRVAAQSHESLLLVGMSKFANQQKSGNLFEKVGQFDVEVETWDVDAKWVLWVCLWFRRLARLTMVRENLNTLQNFEKEKVIGTNVRGLFTKNNSSTTYEHSPIAQAAIL